MWWINTAPVLCNCKIFWQNVKDHENENSIIHMCDLIPHLLSSFCLMAHFRHSVNPLIPKSD